MYESKTSSDSFVEADESLRNLCSPRRSSCLEDSKLTPFKLRWSFGVNPLVPVLNLTSENRTLIAFGCSHAAALYDYTSRDMHLLQGHKNYISMISADAEGKWLLTADCGKESVVIVWDTETRVPIRTFFNPHGSKELLAAKLSPNAKYILTVSNEIEMTMHLWLWSYGRDKPDASTVFTGLGNDRIKEIVFNSNFPNDILLGLETTVVFVTWENGRLNWKEGKINGDVERFGIFCVSTYLAGTHRALTGTRNGYILVWSSVPYEKENSIDGEEVANLKMKHIKSLRLQSCGITAIANHQNMVAIGNTLGQIKFYDNDLKVLFSCQNFGLDRITSISLPLISHRKAPVQTFSESFVASSTSSLNNIEDSGEGEISDTDLDDGWSSIRTPEETLLSKKSKYVIERRQKFSNLASNVTISADPTPPRIEPENCQSLVGIPSDYTLQRAPFLIKDFVVSTVTGRIARIDISSHKCHYILHQSEAAVTAVDAHSDRDILATGNAAGCVCLYEYNNHHLLVSKQTPALPLFEDLIGQDLTGAMMGYVTSPQTHESLVGITALRFSPNGRELACGMQSGALWILHPDTLDAEDPIPFKHSSSSLNDIVFSENSDYMAYRDDNMTTGVYRYEGPEAVDKISGTWKFFGKYQAHALPIKEIFFGPPARGETVPRLFTLSEDGNFVEYDLGSSGPYPVPGLKILTVIHIERSAVPLCMAWYPKFEVERFFIFSNTEYKFKLLNDCTKLIQGTYLGPTFGAPVNGIKFLPIRNMHNQVYMVFSTDTAVGLQLLPCDGNPFAVVGIIGHPRMITRMSLSCCGGFLFTLGYNDPCVLMWKINPRSVDVMAKLGGSSLFPFYRLLDGGQDGWLIKEMRDLFYYAQILHQGENTTARRIVSDKVPVNQLPNLMRAVGHYPSAYELEEMMTEVVSKNYAKTGQMVEEISFEDFVKLYVNHRPVFGVSMEKLKNAFAVHCGTEISSNPVISREEFVKILTEEGDRMNVEEARDALRRLLMPTEEKEKGEEEEEEEEDAAADESFSFLPADISYKDFAVDILGIEVTGEMNTTIAALTNGDSSPTHRSN